MLLRRHRSASLLHAARGGVATTARGAASPRVGLLAGLALAACMVVATSVGGCGDSETEPSPPQPGGSGPGGGAGHGGVGAGGTGAGGGQGGSGGLLADGQPCQDESECESGFCVDDSCCESACADVCHACNVASSEGNCTVHEPGTDPDGDCSGGVCDMVGGCAGGACIWSQAFGNGSWQQAGHAVAADGLGNIVVVGNFTSTIDFGGGPLDGGLGRGFVAKFNPDGQHIWSKLYDASLLAVAVDATGAVFVGGNFEGSVNAGGGDLTSAGGEDIVLFKLNAGGSHLWSQSFGSGGDQQLAALAVDSGGNVIIAGHFAISLKLNPNGPMITLSEGSDDVYVAKYGPTGDHLWAQYHGSTEQEKVVAISIDGEDDVLVVGYFGAALDFWNTSLQGSGGLDLFVAKLASANGEDEWLQGFGHTGDDWPDAVAVDGADNVWVAGSYESVIDFDGGPMVSTGTRDVFVAKRDAAGAHLWSNHFGASGMSQIASQIVADDVGHVVFSGSYNGEVDFGGGVLSGGGGYLVKLTADGVHLWSKDSGENQVWSNGLTLDGASILHVGQFFDTADFGCGVLQSAGMDDIYVVKIGP